MAKLKRGKGKVKPRTGFPWLWVIVALFITVFAIVFWYIFAPHNPPDSPNLKAAIVDQLYTDYPNANFTTEVKEALESYGFQVDVYQGSEVTVNLYRNLPSYDYKLIILRTHSGRVLSSEAGSSEVAIYTDLFTNEPYSLVKYPLEQLDGRLSRAQVTEDSPYVFGIRPSFIIESMEGEFSNTVVIVAGCSALHDDILASAFITKGASAFLSWNASVGLGYVDKATISLVNNLLSEELTLEEAVDVTMTENGKDPDYYSSLLYFPSQSGDKTLGQLIE